MFSGLAVLSGSVQIGETLHSAEFSCNPGKIVDANRKSSVDIL